MGNLRRTRNGVDAIEHALLGVHTSDNDERIINVERHPGLIGTHSVVQINVVDDSPAEHEVIVHLRPRTRRRAR